MGPWENKNPGPETITDTQIAAWPSSYTSFGAQANSGLMNTNGWATVTNPCATAGETNTVTLPMDKPYECRRLPLP